MTSPPGRRAPLARDGTSQSGRRLKELDPEFFAVDERTTADLIRFAERFAAHLAYYPHDGEAPAEPAGDWTPFFASDPSAVLAGFATLPVAAARAHFDVLARFLALDSSRAEEELGDHLRLLFLLPVALLRETGKLTGRLPADHPFLVEAAHLARRELSDPVRRLIGHYRGVTEEAGSALFTDLAFDLDSFASGAYSDRGTRPPTSLARLLVGTVPLSASPPADGDEASDPVDPALVRALGAGTWGELFESTPPDPAPFHGTSPYGRIRSALGDNLLVSAFAGVFGGLERLAASAGGALEESLGDSGDHEPHYGLWLAFLRLLRVQRDQLNGLTEAHLRHYYQDVLRLRPRGPAPDRVHLLVDLARNHDSHLLPAGTAVRAGKDGSGRDVEYRLDREAVVSRARIEALRSVRLLGPDIADDSGVSVSAAPVANSADGLGETDLNEEHPGWPPFGPGGTDAPAARIGLAVADRRLFLREGARHIILRAEVEGLSPESPRGRLAGWLTGPEGWFEVGVEYDRDPDTGAHRFVIDLDGDAPAVIPWNPDLHGTDFGVSAPILRIEVPVERAAGKSEVFEALADARFGSLDLVVEVDGVRDFTAQGELGRVDLTGPFLPFGPTPEPGASLILGSSEVFSKPLDALELDLTWDEQLTAEGFFAGPKSDTKDVRVRRLAKGVWTSGSDHVQFFQDGKVGLPRSARAGADIPQTLENPVYRPTASTGFVRIDLAKHFGHRTFQDTKMKAMIGLASGGTAAMEQVRQVSSRPSSARGAKIDRVWEEVELVADRLRHVQLPQPPYVPKLLEISLSYRTTKGPPAAFFHLHPFGHTREAVGQGSLLPEMDREGALYIGVANLDPPQRLSLLFQVIEGSADPLKVRPSLEWHYLRGNAWKALDGGTVGDATDGLARSGIVTLAVPADADTGHTLLPPGLHWLRLSTGRDADAVSDLLAVHAQAVSATFVDRDNDPGFTSSPLPPETISRLKETRAAIRSISQPYPSFGGRGPETPDSFRIRASERLRHRERAAAPWDYERLVLEQFPRIHRVKCIRHAKPDAACTEEGHDDELRPGHVLVVPVPYVVPGGPVDPLRPYVDSGTIASIETFLRRRTSPFVRLHVRNPRIEEVQVRFEVGFHPEIADLAFYEKELEDALIRFLTPWGREEGTGVRFGGRWHKSEVVNFVEKRPWVDFVKEFEMYHKVDVDRSDGEWQPVDVDVAEATSARSILVSHRRHHVRAIPRGPT